MTQLLLRLHGSGSTVPCGGDELTTGFFANIPGGINAGDICMHFFIRKDVPFLIQRYLLPEKAGGRGVTDADKNAGTAIDPGRFPGFHVLYHSGFQTILPGHPEKDGGIEDPDLRVRSQPRGKCPVAPKLLPAYQQRDAAPEFG